MRLTLFILLLSFTANSQTLFKPGPVAIGVQVIDVYGTVWQSKKVMTNAVTPPAANTFWKLVRTGTGVIDSLNNLIKGQQLLISSLEARIVEAEEPMYFSGLDFLYDPNCNCIKIKR